MLLLTPRIPAAPVVRVPRFAFAFEEDGDKALRAAKSFSWMALMRSLLETTRAWLRCMAVLGSVSETRERLGGGSGTAGSAVRLATEGVEALVGAFRVLDREVVEVFAAPVRLSRRRWNLRFWVARATAGGWCCSDEGGGGIVGVGEGGRAIL